MYDLFAFIYYNIYACAYVCFHGLLGTIGVEEAITEAL
jgi:hypothetical protein